MSLGPDPYDSLFEHTPSIDTAHDRAEIEGRLAEVSRRGLEVLLTSYFEEVPILSRTIVTMLHEGRVEVSAREIHLAALARQGRVFVTLPDGIELLADVIVAPDKRFAVLGRFRYVRILASLRSALRVGVRPRVEIELEVDGARSVATMHDVSLSGCYLTTSHEPLVVGTPVDLRLWLRAGPGRTLVGFVLRGTIARVDGAPAAGYGVRFEHDARSEAELAQFINRMQLELIRQLRED